MQLVCGGLDFISSLVERHTGIPERPSETRSLCMSWPIARDTDFFEDQNVVINVFYEVEVSEADA